MKKEFIKKINKDNKLARGNKLQIKWQWFVKRVTSKLTIIVEFFFVSFAINNFQSNLNQAKKVRNYKNNKRHHNDNFYDGKNDQTQCKIY